MSRVRFGVCWPELFLSFFLSPLCFVFCIRRAKRTEALRQLIISINLTIQSTTFRLYTFIMYIFRVRRTCGLLRREQNIENRDGTKSEARSYFSRSFDHFYFQFNVMFLGLSLYILY